MDTSASGVTRGNESRVTRGNESRVTRGNERVQVRMRRGAASLQLSCIYALHYDTTTGRGLTRRRFIRLDKDNIFNVDVAERTILRRLGSFSRENSPS